MSSKKRFEEMMPEGYEIPLGLLAIRSWRDVMIAPWTEIEAFHNIRKFALSHPEILNGNQKVSYRSKVKLHGTNAGIQIYQDGRVVARLPTYGASNNGS